MLASAKREPAAGQKFLERDELLRRRTLVHAKERRMLPLEQVPRGADVCREHAFLDELVRFVAHDGHDALDLSVRIEFQLELDGLEVERAAARSSGGKHLVQRVEIAQMRQQLGRAVI